MARASAPRPAFIFSYNPTDPDILALAAASESSSSFASTSRHPYHAGLGAPRRPGYHDPAADDHVPVYGPTTHRRGPMRFVPARHAQFGVLPASDEPGATPTIDLKGKGRAVDVKSDEGDEDIKPAVAAPPPPRPSTSSTPSGSAIRGLYAGIVGISSSSSSSAPASVRPSVAPDPPLPQSRSARASSVPVKREDEPGFGGSGDEEDEDDILVLSSDDDSDEEGPGGGRDGQDDDDDDLIVVDPLTGFPEARATAAAPRPRRPQPLLIHELLPPSTSSASTASAAPAPAPSLAGHVPLPPSTPQYGIKPDSVGFRMLVRQGWREGAALGPAAAPGEQQRGLIVPLRAKEKFDRAGLGGGLVGSGEERRMSGRERDERRKERERSERERKKGPGGGRGARGMERAAKEDERRRKALIAYMNRP
ncbi:hypothetical protein JCM9279_003823 [Rhodotorula babjevae]